jgi:hypothetical protein
VSVVRVPSGTFRTMVFLFSGGRIGKGNFKSIRSGLCFFVRYLPNGVVCLHTWPMEASWIWKRK